MTNLKQIEDVLSSFQDSINLMPEDKRHKSQKILDIIRVTACTATAISDAFSRMKSTTKKKRIFPAYCRSPKTRLKREEIKRSNQYLAAKAVSTAYMSAFQVNAIAQRPTLKAFPSGGIAIQSEGEFI